MLATTPPPSGSLASSSGSSIGNGDERHAARSLYISIGTLLLTAVVALLLNELLLNRPYLTPTLAAGMIVGLVAAWLTRVGRFGIAKFLTAAVTLAALTIAVGTGGEGIHDLAIMIYPAVLVIGALLLSRVAFVALTVVTILSASGLVVAEMAGWFHTPFTGQTSYDDVLWVVLFLGVTAVAVRRLADELTRDIGARRQAERELARSHRLLSAISSAQARLIDQKDPAQVFANLLDDVVALTGSGYGFMGEILRTPDGQPYLKSFVRSDIARDAGTEALFNLWTSRGREFHNLDTLFGAVITTGRPVVANDVAHDPRSGGRPDGHPPLRAFMGLPFHSGDQLVGMLGVANRPGGYDEKQVDFLQPILTTCANMLDAIWADRARRRAEEERRLLEAQIQHAQKLESLGVLAGGIAHDFNNLLMVIIGNLDMARAGLPPDSPASEQLAEAAVASRRATSLIRQMLAYSGRGQIVMQTIDLAVLITEMSPMLQVSISKRADLRFHVAPDPPNIEGDPTQIRQIVMNLVINASEAIGESDGTIDLSTGVVSCDRAYLADAILGESVREGPCVFIEVADTGSGMDPETVACIFDPFFTTKFVGRGLGLAAVLGIVRTHGGAIKIRSQVGEGTTLRILIPASAQPIAAVEPAAARADSWRGSGTILLVDDEPAVRTTARAMLERFGYRVIAAADGREALAVFKERRAEIVGVLLDLTMPHMDGEETFRELRAIDPGVRVLLSSGYGEQEMQKRVGGQQLAGLIQKPYELQALGEALRAALGR